MFSFGKKRVVGLEIDDCEVRAVELGKRGSSISLLNWGRMPIEHGVVKDGIINAPNRLGQTLLKLWEERRFKSKSVVIGVSNQGVLVRFANFPKMPPAKLDKFIKFQSQDFLPVSLDSIIFDYSVVGEVEEDAGNKKLHVLLVGAKKDMIDTYIKTLKFANLEPLDIEVSPLALMRCISNEDKKKVIAVVDIAYGLSNIVVSEYGVPKLARMVQSSITHAAEMSACTAEELVTGTKLFTPETMLVWSEILAGEIHTSIGYYLAQKDSKNVDKIILSGRGANFKGLANNLQDMLNVPVETIKPFQNISLASNADINDKSLDFALSISLAYRGMEE